MLTGEQILKKLPYVNIILYEDLPKYKTIESALGKQGLIILYPVKNSTHGHWTCVFRNPNDNKIYFFDSYGYVPDDQLGFMSNKAIKHFDPRDFMYLTKLLYNTDREIDYNNYQFQSDDPNVTTCGYWCLARLSFRNLNSEEFYDLFHKERGVNPDYLVQYYVNYLM